MQKNIILLVSVVGLVALIIFLVLQWEGSSITPSTDLRKEAKPSEETFSVLKNKIEELRRKADFGNTDKESKKALAETTKLMIELDKYSGEEDYKELNLQLYHHKKICQLFCDMNKAFWVLDNGIPTQGITVEDLRIKYPTGDLLNEANDLTRGSLRELRKRCNLLRYKGGEKSEGKHEYCNTEQQYAITELAKKLYTTVTDWGKAKPIYTKQKPGKGNTKFGGIIPASLRSKIEELRKKADFGRATKLSLVALNKANMLLQELKKYKGTKEYYNLKSKLQHHKEICQLFYDVNHVLWMLDNGIPSHGITVEDLMIQYPTPDLLYMAKIGGLNSTIKELRNECANLRYEGGNLGGNRHKYCTKEQKAAIDKLAIKFNAKMKNWPN